MLTFEQWLQSLKTEQRFDFDSEGRGYPKDRGHLMRLAWNAATAPLLERIADLERKSDQDEATIMWQAGEISKHLDRIAELERQLEQAREDALVGAKADMFWNSDDADKPHGSIGCFLNDQICQYDLEVGAEYTIWRAKKLPSVKIRVTAIDDEECEAEYEVIDAAIESKEKP